MERKIAERQERKKDQPRKEKVEPGGDRAGKGKFQGRRMASMRKKEVVTDEYVAEDVHFTMPGGDRNLGELQDEAPKLARRLVNHGDVEGAAKAIARAKHIGVGEEDLADIIEDFKTLRATGQFGLFQEN